MSDDHAAHAISAYGSKINKTPNIDRLAQGGTRFANCFVTNSICTPSRGVIMTGLYSHLSGIKTLQTKSIPPLRTSPNTSRPPAIKPPSSANGIWSPIPPVSTTGRSCPAKASTTTP